MKILAFLIFFSCAHQSEVTGLRGQKILTKMTESEKYRLLRSYRFLQTLSGNHPGQMPISEGYLPGIPRLGIPSVELVGGDRPARNVAREEKTLKLGFVSLIRDFEKTQVFGNFSEAQMVDEIMEPEKSSELRKIVTTGELKDLDLYLVQEGSQGRIRKYVCAQFREENEFHCIAARMESMLKQMGIAEDYDRYLATESLPRNQLNRLVGEVLNTMDELRLL